MRRKELLEGEKKNQTTFCERSLKTTCSSQTVTQAKV